MMFAKSSPDRQGTCSHALLKVAASLPNDNVSRTIICQRLQVASCLDAKSAAHPACSSSSLAGARQFIQSMKFAALDTGLQCDCHSARLLARSHICVTSDWASLQHCSYASLPWAHDSPVCI